MTGSEWEPITWRRRLRVRRITHFTQQCWVRQDVLLSGGLHGSSALLCRYWYCSSSVLGVCVLQVLTFVTCLFSSSLGGPTDPRGPGAEGRVGSHALQSKQTRFPRSHGLVPAAVRISADHGRPDRALQFACFCLHWGEGQVLSPQEVILERILHREPRGAERRRGLSVCGLLPQWCRSAPPLHKNNNQSHHTRRLSRIPRCTCVPQNSESVRFWSSRNQIVVRFWSFFWYFWVTRSSRGQPRCWLNIGQHWYLCVPPTHLTLESSGVQVLVPIRQVLVFTAAWWVLRSVHAPPQRPVKEINDEY